MSSESVEWYPVVSGKLFAGEYPGHPSQDIARKRIESLVEMGVSTFVDLTSAADAMEPYEPFLAEMEEHTGRKLIRLSFPIPDMGVPDNEEIMRAAMEAIREATERNPAAYVHCWGGIGRTGTVIGCWLRECGVGSVEALLRVQKLYSRHMPKSKRIPKSPQTPAQLDYVKFWSGNSN